MVEAENIVLTRSIILSEKKFHVFCSCRKFWFAIGLVDNADINITETIFLIQLFLPIYFTEL